MARTPLFMRVKNAVSVAGEAAERNMAVDRVMQERSAKAISRREFLQKAAAAGVAAVIPDFVWKMGTVRAKESSSVDGRIVIVGAGLAGLTCAYQLKKAGLIAEIYEAADRVGGRCLSRRDYFQHGQIAERGGELIDSGHTEIIQLTAELGLRLDDVIQAQPKGTEELYYFGGKPYMFEQACRDFKGIWQKLQNESEAADYPTLYNQFTPRGKQLDEMSIRDWICEYVPGGRHSKLGQLLESAYAIEYGAEASDQSALNLIYLLADSDKNRLDMYGLSDERYHVRGGNDQIVSRLAEAVKDQIVTRTRLTAMCRNDNRSYTLTMQSGSETRDITANKVILTVPFSILRSSVDLSKAGFRPLKLKAIHEQGMGSNAKLHVQFTDRHWTTLGCNGNTYSDTGYQNTWDGTRGQAGAAGILVNFTGGGAIATSSHKRTPAECAEQLLKQIEPVLPGLTGKWNGKATLDDWQGYRWTKGSYSYWRVGQYTKFAGVEREKEGSCYFAGEHTSIDSQGYLNGAVESGQRAANEVVADLKASGLQDTLVPNRV